MIAKNRLAITITNYGLSLVVALILFATILSLILDIPFFRQISGFLFLTFLPGWLLTYVLKLRKLNIWVRFVLSVGISIGFIMIYGLLINSIYPFFGFTKPLTTVSLVVSFTIAILVLTVVAYLRNGHIRFTNIPILRLSVGEKAHMILPVIMPMLSIVGTRFMNTTDNNIALILLLLLIPAYITFLVINQITVSETVYIITILCVSISLLFLLGLRSNHLIGVDIHVELNYFQQTVSNGRWQILMNNALENSSLSISILPTIYQSFININSEYLFKIIYPILFSISPLIIYIISRKYLNAPYSILAALFFMSQTYFLDASSSPPTVLAILFSALAFLTLSNDGIPILPKRILFIIFVIGAIFSHYATTYILLGVLTISWILLQIAPRIIGNLNDLHSTTRQTSSLGHRRQPQYITLGLIMVAFVIMFYWYSEATGAAFDNGVNFIAHSLSSIRNFFDMESRGTTAVILGAGTGPKTIPLQIFLIVSWITVVFIAVGVITTGINHRHTISSYSDSAIINPDSLVGRIDIGYYLSSIACSIVLVVSIALPFIFVGYAMDRTYIQMMTILAPFLIVGGVRIASFIHFKLPFVLILMVLIPYFLSNTGMIYQIMGVQQSISLNSGGSNYDLMYIYDEEYYSAKWVKCFVADGNTIYADYYGNSRLRGQINIPVVYPSELIDQNKPLGSGYIYLRYYNVVKGKLLDRSFISHDIKQYGAEFSKRDLLYSNGGSQVWR